MADFKLGDTVFVIPLRKNGQIVKIGNNGEFRVELDTGVVKCKPDQLQLAIKSTVKKDAFPAAKSSIKISSDAVHSGPSLRSLDLHGMTVAQAKAVVEEHISRAVMANLGEVEILHGHGSGALKNSLHQLLSQLSVVKGFALKEFNSGVTRVFL